MLQLVISARERVGMGFRILKRGLSIFHSFFHSISGMRKHLKQQFSMQDIFLNSQGGGRQLRINKDHAEFHRE